MFYPLDRKKKEDASVCVSPVRQLKICPVRLDIVEEKASGSLGHGAGYPSGVGVSVVEKENDRGRCLERSSGT